jgi:hypothetical protein
VRAENKDPATRERLKQIEASNKRLLKCFDDVRMGKRLNVCSHVGTKPKLKNFSLNKDGAMKRAQDID